MADCIFCKIAAGEIPARVVYEDDKVLAFHDLNPQAPVHVLLIPKMHIESCNGITAENSAVVAAVFEAAGKVAALCGVREDGYRIITNTGAHACQSVKHLHFHLLGGVQLSENIL
ncbi:MAG: histidine triad nucleotide-binding protein [Clostridia bacterium]|nr:histidine triad nucleotide-binding protein [Clostridia bacterium]